jgi:predicted DNA binding CopG/RHH family protein
MKTDKATLDPNTIFDDVEKWESGELGSDEAHVQSVGMPQKLKRLLNKSQEKRMQLVSIRLPVELIDDLKNIGKLEGIGYQSLAREVLNRFVEAENRKRINSLILEKRKLEKELEDMKHELEHCQKRA